LVIKKDRPRWFEHVECKDDAEHFVDDRTRQRRLPRKTWLSGVKDIKSFWPFPRGCTLEQVWNK